MDQTTFSNPQVVEYINENYHAVKFDAEQRDELTVNGNTYGFRPGGRRGGTHELALALAVDNGRIGYPTLAILDEEGAKLLTAPGYKTAQQLDVLLNYYGSGHHRDLDLEVFKRVYSSPIK
jgi:thioredoxin-related protein